MTKHVCIRCKKIRWGKAVRGPGFSKEPRSMVCKPCFNKYGKR